MKKCIIRFLISLFFILIGCLVYILFNNNIINNTNSLCIIIRNYIPDLCWSISFFFASIVFMKNLVKKYLLINSIFILTLSIFFECMQLLNYYKGTYDFWDICIYFLAVLLSIIIELVLRSGENEKIC